MDHSRRHGRRLALAGAVAAVLLVGGLWAGRAAWSVPGLVSGATTRILDRSDPRFDVLVQHHPEALGTAGEQLSHPDGEPRLTAAQAFAIAHGERQPHGAKPSVRLATFTDADFPTPVGAGHRLVPRAKRALVWVVVVPDVPVVAFGAVFGPDFGPNSRPDSGARGPQSTCPSYTPVDALTGEPLGIWIC
jgi:hypothetical protein